MEKERNRSTDRDIVYTIVGKRGVGKTTLAYSLFCYMRKDYDIVMANDFIGEFSKKYHFTRITTFNELKENIKRNNVYLAYQGNEFKRFLRWAWMLAEGLNLKVLCILDEIDLIEDCWELQRLYRYGRHYKIGLIAVSRRFYNLQTIVRALTNRFYLFRITEERDLQYISHIDKKLPHILKNLKNYQYIILNL